MYFDVELVLVVVASSGIDPERGLSHEVSAEVAK